MSNIGEYIKILERNVNMKSRKIRAFAAVVAIAALTGCSGGNSDEAPFYRDKTRQELIDLCDEYTNNIADLQNQYDELYKLYNGIQSENKPSEAIGITGDGTGRFTFNSVDHKIIFPEELTYPGSVTITANGDVNIVQNVSISAGSNWVLKTGTASIELEHISGISGTIKAGAQYFMYTAEELRDNTIKPWFEKLPMSSITYSNISIAGQPLGCQAVSPTIIDGESAMIRVGLIAHGNNSLTYTFVYRGEQDASKDEIITQMLNTMMIDGLSVLIEQ